VADFNGDDYDDLIISRSIGEDEYYMQIEVYLGSETMTTTPHFVSEIYGIYGGFFIPAKGDINGDGYDDIIVPDVGVFLGNEDGILNLDYPEFFGSFINMNNDAYTDLIIVSSVQTKIYLGSENIDLTNPDIVFTHEMVYSGCNIGDFLGNGSDELLISFEGNTNSATLYTFNTSHTEDTIISVEHHLINFPNPFNPSTTIQFSSELFEQNELIALEIYNIKGQIIRHFNIHNSQFKMNEVVWDGTDEFGNSVSSGVYLYKLVANGKTKAVKKCLLMK
jgi:hypothetical protein